MCVCFSTERIVTHERWFYCICFFFWFLFCAFCFFFWLFVPVFDHSFIVFLFLGFLNFCYFCFCLMFFIHSQFQIWQSMLQLWTLLVFFFKNSSCLLVTILVCSILFFVGFKMYFKRRYTDLRD